MAHVRESQEGDLTHLVHRLRAADLKELRAHKADPETALRHGLKFSEPCYTIEHNGQPIGMFGVAPHPGEPSVGVVWLLGSDGIADESVRIRFLRESRKWLETIAESYELLCNVVHEENELHIKWLKFLGFQFIRQDSPFIEFVRLTACATPQ